MEKKLEYEFISRSRDKILQQIQDLKELSKIHKISSKDMQDIQDLAGDFNNCIGDLEYNIKHITKIFSKEEEKELNAKKTKKQQEKLKKRMTYPNSILGLHLADSALISSIFGGAMFFGLFSWLGGGANIALLPAGLWYLGIGLGTAIAIPAATIAFKNFKKLFDGEKIQKARWWQPHRRLSRFLYNRSNKKIHKKTHLSLRSSAANLTRMTIYTRISSLLFGDDSFLEGKNLSKEFDHLSKTDREELLESIAEIKETKKGMTLIHDLLEEKKRTISQTATITRTKENDKDNIQTHSSASNPEKSAETIVSEQVAKSSDRNNRVSSHRKYGTNGEKKPSHR